MRSVEAGWGGIVPRDRRQCQRSGRRPRRGRPRPPRGMAGARAPATSRAPTGAHRLPAFTNPATEMPPAVQFIVEGGRTLSGTIRPSGNKNAALPIVAAALLSDQLVVLENVPRIRDIETLVELIRTLGVSAEWKERNTLHIHAK